ncbi:Hypothetical protein, putative [Bodo saltans]|uniref:Uncharacterized protein n=1 Tax=Bodo saltans TaxID=75058 RepID=A0A0S4IPB0_BODSA|nr:Hypothetical protein, putative [Bodo saltans]|eukprot:CUE92302.1 Hypothetical protein, putative [Bodo saltans]
MLPLRAAQWRGVSPCCSRAETSALASRRTLTVSKSTLHTARCRGVSPFFKRVPTSAPAPKRTLITPTKPRLIARPRGCFSIVCFCCNVRSSIQKRLDHST